MWSKTITGRQLILDVYDYDAILIPMGINNAIGHGLMYDVCLNFPPVKDGEKTTPYGDRRKYGNVCVVNDEGISFCMCYMVKPTNRKQEGYDFVDYESLEKCLIHVNDMFKGRNVATPILGYDKLEGNGDKEKILKLIYGTIKDVESLTVYDFEQQDTKLEMFKRIAEVRKRLKDKVITADQYIKERSRIEWERRYGIYKPYDERYRYIPRKGAYLEKE